MAEADRELISLGGVDRPHTTTGPHGPEMYPSAIRYWTLTKEASIEGIAALRDDVPFKKLWRGERLRELRAQRDKMVREVMERMVAEGHLQRLLKARLLAGF